jgi:hypothetical protein
LKAGRLIHRRYQAKAAILRKWLWPSMWRQIFCVLRHLTVANDAQVAARALQIGMLAEKVRKPLPPRPGPTGHARRLD